MKTRNGAGRLFIFGWDGADWEVIREAWKQGRLPVLRSIVERGQAGTLLSTIPPITSVAWTSFLTGVGPGEHGIFGFRSVDPETYRLSPVPGGSRRVPTLFQALDRHGYRTCLVTVPWTYPADPLTNGACVPGWDAPDETLGSCHPPDVAEALGEVVNRVPRRGPASSEPATFLHEQSDNISLRERISAFLIERIDPHVFMVVFSEPDQGTHHLWEKPEIPPSLIRAYEQVDAAMGRLLQRYVRDDDAVLVVSDHGSAALHTFIHVGKLLAAGGWLKIADAGPVSRRTARGAKRHLWYRLPPRMRNAATRSLPKSLRRKVKRSLRRADIDWENTVAFPVGSEAPGIGIRINMNPPFSRGPVTQATYGQIRDRVATYLRGVEDPSSGKRVFARVAFKEDVYSGGALSTAPDLVLVPEAGYGIRPGLDFTAPLSRVAIGEHRREGIYVASPPIGLEEDESIEQLLPKVLRAEGFVLDEVELDGRVVSEQSVPQEASEGYDPQEAVEIESRLRELGYIE